MHKKVGSLTSMPAFYVSRETSYVLPDPTVF